MKPHPWWEVFLGNENNEGNDLVDVANAILGTCKLHMAREEDRNANEPRSDAIDLYVDWLVSSKGFVRSIVKSNKDDPIEKNFNDPDSFLWFYHKELFEKEIQNEANSI